MLGVDSMRYFHLERLQFVCFVFQRFILFINKKNQKYLTIFSSNLPLSEMTSKSTGFDLELFSIITCLT